ncbi:hypothetical protein FRC11_001834, partial [Ceratobasidium sp. 423]
PSMGMDTPKERHRKYACFTEGECNRFSLRGSRRNLVMNFAKDHAVLLFHTAIVAPHNKSYVAGLGAFIEDDLVHNHALYKLEKIIVEDEESRGKLKTQMRTRLTALRNAIKNKVIETIVSQRKHAC